MHDNSSNVVDGLITPFFLDQNIRDINFEFAPDAINGSETIEHSADRIISRLQMKE